MAQVTQVKERKCVCRLSKIKKYIIYTLHALYTLYIILYTCIKLIENCFFMEQFIEHLGKIKIHF